MINAKTPEKIHYAIQHRLAKGVSYIEALLEYAKENDLEVEAVAEIVKKSEVMREKIREEAIAINMVKPDDTNTVC